MKHRSYVECETNGCMYYSPYSHICQLLFSLQRCAKNSIWNMADLRSNSAAVIKMSQGTTAVSVLAS